MNPLKNLPEFINKIDGFKLAADLNLRHITQDDVYRLGKGGEVLSRIGEYDYGFVITTHHQAEGLEAEGFSKIYIALLQLLWENQIYYAFLDTDAPVWADIWVRPDEA